MEAQSDKTPPPPMVFFSGLAADSKLFALQKLQFENLVTPEWILPQPSESLEDYTARWITELKAQKIELDEQTLIGGASFGGLVAQEMARQTGAKNCLLFGSIKSPEEIPFRIRWLKPIHKLAFVWIIQFWQIVIRILVKLIGFCFPWRIRSVLKQFSGSDARLVKWSIRQFFAHTGRLRREQNPHPDAPTIHQVHGDKDPVFPISKIKQRDNAIVYKLEETGHLMTLSNSKEVNRIIESVVSGASQVDKVQAEPDAKKWTDSPSR